MGLKNEVILDGVRLTDCTRSTMVVMKQHGKLNTMVKLYLKFHIQNTIYHKHKKKNYLFKLVPLPIGQTIIQLSRSVHYKTKSV